MVELKSKIDDGVSLACVLKKVNDESLVVKKNVWRLAGESVCKLVKRVVG